MGEHLKNLGVGLVIAAVVIAAFLGAAYVVTKYEAATYFTIAGAAFLFVCYHAGRAWRNRNEEDWS